jgi:hypothetical protein
MIWIQVRDLRAEYARLASGLSWSRFPPATRCAATRDRPTAEVMKPARHGVGIYPGLPRARSSGAI